MVEFEGSAPRLKNIFQEAKLKSRLPDESLDEYRDLVKGLVTFVRRLDFKPPGKGLFFFGRNGSGKSFMAAAVANEIEVVHKAHVMRVSVMELIDAYFSEWRVPEEFFQVKVLVLEELNKEIPTKQGHSEAVLENLLKVRFEKGLCTIITTNSSIEQIDRRYGPTVVSVLKGRCLPVRFPEEDLREIQGSIIFKKHER